MNKALRMYTSFAALHAKVLCTLTAKEQADESPTVLILESHVHPSAISSSVIKHSTHAITAQSRVKSPECAELSILLPVIWVVKETVCGMTLISVRRSIIVSWMNLGPIDGKARKSNLCPHPSFDKVFAQSSWTRIVPQNLLFLVEFKAITSCVSLC